MSTMSRRDQNRQVALNASAAGLLVVPLKPDKTPYIKWRGLTTTGAHWVHRWWNNYPDAIPGIITNDVIAFDSDRHGPTDGVAAWDLLVEANALLPEHPVTLTPNDGEHHYFRMPDGERLGNSRGTLPDGIDVRGVGGYVVAPGAILPDGREWRSAPGTPSLYDAYKSGNGALPCAPDWLLNEIRKRKLHGAETALNNGRYSFDHGKITNCERAFAQAALDNICAKLRAMPRNSGRNDALNGAAYRLGRMAARGWIEEQVVFHALRQACGDNGLMEDDPRQVERTLQSGWRAGVCEPHPDLENRPFKRSTGKGAAHNGAHVNGHDDAAEDGDNDPLPLYVRESRDDRFPINALGDELAKAVRALQAATQTPIEMAANSILGTISFAAQAHGNIQLPIAGDPAPVSLFLLTIARSGERKTTNDKIALKGVSVYQGELRETYRDEYAKYKNKIEIWESARKKIIANKTLSPMAKERQIDALGPEPELPMSPVMIFSDPTVQAIGRQLCEHRPSLGLFSSEGAVVLNGYSFGKEQKANAAGIYSQLWDGHGVDKIRVGDGEGINPGCRLTIHLAAQRKVATKFLNDEDLRDQGIISRFLVADPESTMGTRIYRKLDKHDQEALERFEQNLLKILRRPLPIKKETRNELEPAALVMSDETRLAWVTFHDEVERKLVPGGEYEPIAGIACKLPENAARIGACIALYQHAAGNANALLSEIDQDSFNQGVELARFYARTALRLVDTEEPDRELTDAEKLLDWLKSTWVPGGEDRLVSLPDIVQFGPRWIRKSATAQQVMRVLQDHRHVEVVPAQVVRNKPRREVWRIA